MNEGSVGVLSRRAHLCLGKCSDPTPLGRATLFSWRQSSNMPCLSVARSFKIRCFNSRPRGNMPRHRSVLTTSAKALVRSVTSWTPETVHYDWLLEPVQHLLYNITISPHRRPTASSAFSSLEIEPRLTQTCPQTLQHVASPIGPLTCPRTALDGHFLSSVECDICISPEGHPTAAWQGCAGASWLLSGTQRASRHAHSCCLAPRARTLPITATQQSLDGLLAVTRLRQLCPLRSVCTELAWQDLVPFERDDNSSSASRDAPHCEFQPRSARLQRLPCWAVFASKSGSGSQQITQRRVRHY